MLPIDSRLIDLANEKSLDRKIDSARLNVEVCSILIAAVSISFGLSDLSLLFHWTRILVVICLGLGVLLFMLAIIIEADAVFNYSRGREAEGDYFDQHGYKLMKFAFLFSLITVNYLACGLVPAVIELPNFWSQLGQATLPIVFGLIPFLIWRIFKVRKLGRKWYMVW